MRRSSDKIPRLGFLGIGWIGFQRMESIARSGWAEVAAISDPSKEACARAGKAFPKAVIMSLEALLSADLDGIVIATPSAEHFSQTMAALDRGIPVFCQKPLGRNVREVTAMVDTARKANLLLGVDLSYRFTRAVERMREVISGGEIGKVFAASLVFHNAYGPDKAWFYQRELSGGGCLIDLGIHLVDLATWILDSPVSNVRGRLFCKGEPVTRCEQIEDYAVAELDMKSAAVQIACSWNLHAGRDAVIEAAFYGDRGGVVLKNIDGSFYDFTAEQCNGTSRRIIARPPDTWSGRAAVDWARRLATGEGFDPGVERAVEVAGILDRIYAGVQG